MFPLINGGLLKSPRPGFPAMVYRHRAGFGKGRQNSGSLRRIKCEWRYRDARMCGHFRSSFEPQQLFSVVLPGSAH
jgi:hypothetical protein